jgi:hypothetical protein
VSFRRYWVLWIVPLLPAASGQQLPPVYFNHMSMFMDQATLDNLMASPFLNTDFSAFDKITMQRDGGKWSYTGIYLTGRATYLEFLPGTPKGEPPKNEMSPLGTVALGMWIDQRSQLPRLRDKLAEKSHSHPDIKPEKEFHAGHDLTWFDALVPGFPDEESVRADAWIMAVYPAYLKQRYPDLKPEQDGTDRQKQLARYYSANKLFRAITRVTLTVNQAEQDRLALEFAAYGYVIRTDGAKKIATGPEFELEMIPVPQDSPRKLAISLQLNRAKEGPQIIKIGDTSELRFHGDSAIWYFPKPW